MNYKTLGKNLEFDEPYHAWEIASLDGAQRCAADWVWLCLFNCLCTEIAARML